MNNLADRVFAAFLVVGVVVIFIALNMALGA